MAASTNITAAVVRSAVKAATKGIDDFFEASEDIKRVPAVPYFVDARSQLAAAVITAKKAGHDKTAADITSALTLAWEVLSDDDTSDRFAGLNARQGKFADAVMIAVAIV